MGLRNLDGQEATTIIGIQPAARGSGTNIPADKRVPICISYNRNGRSPAVAVGGDWTLDHFFLKVEATTTARPSAWPQHHPASPSGCDVMTFFVPHIATSSLSTWGRWFSASHHSSIISSAKHVTPRIWELREGLCGQVHSPGMAPAEPLKRVYWYGHDNDP